ncbi:MAG TPA: chemotaxis protein CheW [Steroidobacteraceae bacterium]|nr:chemotaxis protein CheW [Steroidobacteraceae bacterium]
MTDRFLLFRVDSQLYALRSDEVTEIIRVPIVAKVPQSPVPLLGLANLRGTVLPVVGLREMLGKPPGKALTSARAIILDAGAPVALVVDSVSTLEAVDSGQIEVNQKDSGAAGEEKLLGAFPCGADKEVAKILDIKTLLQIAFSNRSRGKSAVGRTRADVQFKGDTGALKKMEMLVTFEVAGQEFALPLDSVQEILPLPPSLTAIARAETVVLGITSVRDTLMPVLSLRGLLGFGASGTARDREKVIVMKFGGEQIGLVADQARSIVSADPDLMDPIPPILAARTGGESRIRSVYRGEAGRRLISILSPDQMFREDVMQKLPQHQAHQAPGARAAEENREELIFLVFRLGDDEFGLPIDAVVEVAQVPAQITRVPKTPKFLEGVVNLRGEVLPVVDQRRRFDMPKLENVETRRLVVVKTERHRAGIIVDSVSDVLRSERAGIAPPPDLTDEKTARLIHGVINLEKAHRIVLLLDPTELLTRAEQGLLDTFQVQSKKANA